MLRQWWLLFLHPICGAPLSMKRPMVYHCASAAHGGKVHTISLISSPLLSHHTTTKKQQQSEQYIVTLLCFTVVPKPQAWQVHPGTGRNNVPLHHRLSPVHQQQVLQAVLDLAAPSAQIAQQLNSAGKPPPQASAGHPCTQSVIVAVTATVMKIFYPESPPSFSPNPASLQGLQAHLPSSSASSAAPLVHGNTGQNSSSTAGLP